MQDAVGWADPSISVSVNVPADELRRGEFADLLIDLLAVTGLPASSVKLEVLETQLADSAPVLEAIERLVDAGVSFVVDDFGTGYSTLSYLKRLPVSAVKVDRSFVGSICDDPADLSIVRAVVEACRATGRQCVAEGVETAGPAAPAARARRGRPAGRPARRRRPDRDLSPRCIAAGRIDLDDLADAALRAAVDVRAAERLMDAAPVRRPMSRRYHPRPGCTASRRRSAVAEVVQPVVVDAEVVGDLVDDGDAYVVDDLGAGVPARRRVGSAVDR